MYRYVNANSVKNKFYLAIAAILIAPLFQGFTPQKTYTLREAVLGGKVSATYTANPDATHYTRPLKLVLVNLTSEQVKVTVENGTMFYPEDSAYQNLIVTCAGSVQLGPKQKKETALYAMCTESGDGAPSGGMTYALGQAADEKLVGLSRLLEEKKWFDITGQKAVWAMADPEGTIASVYGPDKTQVETLRKYLHDNTGKRMPTAEELSYENDYYAEPRMDMKIEGTIGFNFSWPASVSIALFNTDNVVVRELYNNPSVTPGEHRVNYAFDNSVFTDSVYYARLVCDGEVRINRKIELF